jgi:hypothetical protein
MQRRKLLPAGEASSFVAFQRASTRAVKTLASGYVSSLDSGFLSAHIGVRQPTGPILYQVHSARHTVNDGFTVNHAFTSATGFAKWRRRDSRIRPVPFDMYRLVGAVSYFRLPPLTPPSSFVSSRK